MPSDQRKHKIQESMENFKGKISPMDEIRGFLILARPNFWVVVLYYHSPQFYFIFLCIEGYPIGFPCGI